MSESEFPALDAVNASDLSNTGAAADTNTDIAAAQAGIPGGSIINEPDEPSRFKKLLKKVAWTFFGVICLITFTLFKLPEEKIRGFIQGSIGSALASQGISFNAGKSRLSAGLGISYAMNDVVVSFPPPQDPVKVESVAVSPSILGLLTGRMGATLQIENRGGSLNMRFSEPLSVIKSGAGIGGDVSLQFTSDKLDIGTLGILPLLAGGMKASAVANGTGEINGDPNIPSSLDGGIQLDLSKIVIEAQTFMGFTIPRLLISEGHIDIVFQKGKAIFKSVRLGKAGNTADDIHATITGDMQLGHNWNASTINAKAEFSLSKNVLSAFALLEALLQQAKRPDGSYGYQLTGPVGAMNTMPLPK